MYLSFSLLLDDQTPKILCYVLIIFTLQYYYSQQPDHHLIVLMAQANMKSPYILQITDIILRDTTYSYKKAKSNFRSGASSYYRVINLRMPKSKPLLSHYLLSEHVFILGAFNQFSAYILIFEIGFLIFQNLIFGPKW